MAGTWEGGEMKVYDISDFSLCFPGTYFIRVSLLLRETGQVDQIWYGRYGCENSSLELKKECFRNIQSTFLYICW